MRCLIDNIISGLRNNYYLVEAIVWIIIPVATETFKEEVFPLWDMNPFINGFLIRGHPVMFRSTNNNHWIVEGGRMNGLPNIGRCRIHPVPMG